MDTNDLISVGLNMYNKKINSKNMLIQISDVKESSSKDKRYVKIKPNKYGILEIGMIKPIKNGDPTFFPYMLVLNTLKDEFEKTIEKTNIVIDISNQVDTFMIIFKISNYELFIKEILPPFLDQINASDIIDPNIVTADADYLIQEYKDQEDDIIKTIRKKFDPSEDRLNSIIERLQIPDSNIKNFRLFYRNLINISDKRTDIDFLNNTKPLTANEIAYNVFHGITKLENSYSKITISNKHKIYSTQLVAAADAMLHFFNGATFIHLAAHPQQGKTGVLDVLINVMTKYFYLNILNDDRVKNNSTIALLTTGVGFIEVNSQLQQISEDFGQKFDAEDNELRPIRSYIDFTKKYKLNVTSENKKSQLEQETNKVVNELFETIYPIIITDEDHYGQGNESMLDAKLFSEKLIDYLKYNSNRLIVTLSATGYGTQDFIVNELKDSAVKAEIVTIPTSENYKGVNWALEHSVDYNELVERYGSFENIIINKIQDAVNTQHNGLYVFRVTNKIDQYKELLEDHFGHQIDLRILDQSRGTALTDLKELDTLNDKVYVLLVNRLFALGTDAGELKNYIRLFFDKSSNNVAQIIQSIGRTFGYHDNDDIELIYNITTLQLHKLVHLSNGQALNRPEFIRLLNENSLKLETHYKKDEVSEVFLGVDNEVFVTKKGNLLNNDELIKFLEKDGYDSTELISYFYNSFNNSSYPRPKSCKILTRRTSKTEKDIKNQSNYYRNMFDFINIKIKNNRTFFRHVIKQAPLRSIIHRNEYLNDIENHNILIVYFYDKVDHLKDMNDYLNNIIIVKPASNPNLEFVENKTTPVVMDGKAISNITRNNDII